MKNRFPRQLIAFIFLFAIGTANGQPVKKIFASSGIWGDYSSPPVLKSTCKKVKGRLVNVNWSDIETAPGVWKWSAFDNDINQHIADGLPIIFMVYTDDHAPNWLYSNGVPKVTVTDNNGTVTGYAPYYLNNKYNFYFKRMIDSVKQHLQSMPVSARNKIIGVQGCYGSTGDQISYEGNVPQKYFISTSQFDSLFKVYSLYYYNNYNTLNPPVALLSNANYNDPTEDYWLAANCPGGWMKCGSMGKGSQLNGESDKLSWLYDMLNKPTSGNYVKARCEITGDNMSSGWWTKNQYKDFFAIMCYDIFWGLDWPNETPTILKDVNFDSSLTFFNKYAGQKVAGLATNALCALKDALDASDSVRFPSSVYGKVSQTNATRYKNIYNSYKSYGAKLEDVNAATGNEGNNLSAAGINDVGWHLLPGNYERYLHQINANATSTGYWNIDAAHNTVMYGRYGRGFDVANNKNALYFDVEDNFLRNRPLNSVYPATIEITYFDSGYGSWQLHYDAQTNYNKASVQIKCNNTGKWKKSKVVLKDARFGNGGSHHSDFYISNTGSQNVIFSVIELSRSPQYTGSFVTTTLATFDTSCINAVPAISSFVLNADSLDGSNVKIGPLKGYSFSRTNNGTFTNSLVFSNYAAYDFTLNRTIYVKMNTDSAGSFTGKIPITGGGLATAFVNATGAVVNSSPALNAVATTVSCYNKQDGAINLNPKGGSGPFSYKWTNSVQRFWTATTQDISALKPANYTVMVNSAYGCRISKTFDITQPNVLITSVAEDSAIICKGGSTTVTVSATGGTKPYSGTGNFIKSAGFQSYTVKDARGCSDVQGYSVSNGTVTAPPKPSGINGLTSVQSLQSGLAFSVKNYVSSYNYKWTVPSGAQIIAGQNTNSIKVMWGTATGDITVTAKNSCGSSPAFSQKITIINGLQAGSMGAFTSNGQSTAEMNELMLMPNPVSDIATVLFDAATSYPFTMELTDVNGKTLLIKKGISTVGSNNEHFNVHDFAAGTYFVTLIDNTGQRKTVKMMKL
jgi:hypothetical protein